MLQLVQKLVVLRANNCNRFARDYMYILRYLLLTRKADVQAKDNGGLTPLMLAALHEQELMCKWLVLRGKASLKSRENEGKTALMLVAERGLLTMVQWLISAKDPIDAATRPEGNTALMLAATAGQMEVVQWMVREGGAKIDLKNSDGLLAWRHAGVLCVYLLGLISTNQHRIASLHRTSWVCSGRSRGGWPHLVHCTHAGMAGHLDVMKWLITEGNADVNAKDRYGGTALTVGASTGNLQLVKYLVVTMGATVDDTTHNGRTALMEAALAGRLDVCMFLVDHGADINLEDHDGRDAQLLATGAAQWDTAKYVTRLKMRAALGKSMPDMPEWNIIMKEAEVKRKVRVCVYVCVYICPRSTRAAHTHTQHTHTSPVCDDLRFFEQENGRAGRVERHGRNGPVVLTACGAQRQAGAGAVAGGGGTLRHQSQASFFFLKKD